MYAMLGTRPDISYAIMKLSQFSSNPTQEHFKAGKHVLRYLKNTMHLCLRFGSIDDSEVTGFSDSDWGSNPNDRRLITGYTFLIGGGAVSWASKKQPTVTLSSTEAEYMALSNAARYAIWIQSLLLQICFNLSNPLPISVDNKDCYEKTLLFHFYFLITCLSYLILSFILSSHGHSHRSHQSPNLSHDQSPDQHVFDYALLWT
jgi:hypothetical protein